MRHFAHILLALALLLGLSAEAIAANTQVSNYTPSGGPIAAGAAGAQIGTSGWCDVAGGKWSVDSNNNLVSTAAVGSTWNTQALARCASSENSMQGEITTSYTNSAAANQVGLILRYSGGSAVSGYGGSCGNGQANAYLFNSGAATNLKSATGTLTVGTAYKCDVTVVQTNSTTTTVTVTLTTLAGVQVAQAVGTDTTAALQNKSGGYAVYKYGASDDPITNLITYVAAATSYTISGPSGGATGQASQPFTITMNGVLASATTFTPSDGGNGGTFSPAAPSIAANASSTTFTYQPASTGNKSLTSTNNQSLTDPSAVTYQSLVLVATSSAAFHFSPANWQCYGSRGCASGVVNPRTIQAGAYFCTAWTASSSPTAQLAFSVNTNAVTISYFLNGLLVDNVATSGGPVSLSPVASATNQLMVVVRAIGNPGANIWGQTGANFYGLEIGGLLIDAASSPGTAPAPCQPSGATNIAFKGWGLVQGTSINVGYRADGVGADNYLHSNIWLAAQSLLAQGYDIGSVATSGSGILVPGTADDNFVPPLYSVTSAGYQASGSRWNMTDAAVSLLDANAHLSAYGAVGTEPVFVFNSNGANDGRGGVNTTYLQQAVTGLLTAERAAAPNAKLILVPDGPSYTTFTSILAAIQAGAAAYTGDAGFTFMDQPTGLPGLIYNNTPLRADALHPLFAGNAYMGPFFQGVIQKAITIGVGRQFQRGFR